MSLSIEKSFFSLFCIYFCRCWCLLAVVLQLVDKKLLCFSRELHKCYLKSDVGSVQKGNCLSCLLYI